MNPSLNGLLSVMNKKNYVVHDSGRLNVVGIRTNDQESNRFNDFISAFYRFDGNWSYVCFPATTDPGTYWRQHPENVSGVAILKPGQYVDSHMVGLHRGYKALQQRGLLTVYRDADKDGKLNVVGARKDSGIFGINIHRAGEAGPSIQVDKWSAGCQVLADPDHFTFLMRLCDRSATQFQNLFTYTLLVEADLWP